MNIKEKIEENVAVWLLGTLLTGFVSGIGAYKAVIEIANLQVVPSSEAPEELKKELEELRAANSEISVKYEDCEKGERGSGGVIGVGGEISEDFRWRSESARQLLVRLVAPTTEGAGIIVASAGNRIYIVTAKHVMFQRGRPVKDLAVMFRQAPASAFPIDYSKVEFKFDYENDIAAFSLDLSAQRELQISIEEALSMFEIQDAGAASLGEFLYIAGHSTASSWQVSLPGDYKFYKREGGAFLISGSCPQGYAGGAVYGKSWKLIGMTIDEERPFCRAISMSLLKAFLARHWTGIDLGFRQ